MPLTSQICKASDFRQPWFARWRPHLTGLEANGVPLAGAVLHRKEWEFVAITQALHERGLLEPGRRGLGFGVGREPLPALFAGLGCDITATDLEHDGGRWSGSWAAGLQDLLHTALPSGPEVAERLTFRPVDMNAIGDELTGYDFVWSSSSLEHLGSFERGMTFLRRQLDCVKPGGWGVHTTEFNLTSSRAAGTEGTVVFGQRDLADLQADLATAGHRLLPLVATLGHEDADHWVARPPWDDAALNPSLLRLRIGDCLATSVLLVTQRSPSR